MRMGILGLSIITAAMAPPLLGTARSRALRPITLVVSNLAAVPRAFMTRAERDVVRL
jgi:hypothetical protein